MKDIREDARVRHSVPAVAIQHDIGYGILGIEYFCNRSDHQECREDLQRVLKQGGRVAVGTHWYGRYEKAKEK